MTNFIHGVVTVVGAKGEIEPGMSHVAELK